MGWWRVKDNRETLVLGDRPTDIMSRALEQIFDAYEETWGTKPSLAELQACLEFCAFPLLKQKVKQ